MKPKMVERNLQGSCAHSLPEPAGHLHRCSGNHSEMTLAGNVSILVHSCVHCLATFYFLSDAVESLIQDLLAKGHAHVAALGDDGDAITPPKWHPV